MPFNSSHGLGLLGTITVVLAILKIFKLITIGWFWVLLPFFLPVFIILFVVGIILGTYALMEFLQRRRH